VVAVGTSAAVRGGREGGRDTLVATGAATSTNAGLSTSASKPAVSAGRAAGSLLPSAVHSAARPVQLSAARRCRARRRGCPAQAHRTRLDAFDRKVLNVNKAQEAVKQVITDPVTGYGVENVTNVRCNNGENPTAKKGDTFTCEVTVDGKKHEVRAVFIDDNGTYEVDRPR
jgi:hypothetical protein